MNTQEIIALFEKRRNDLLSMYSGKSQQYLNLSKKHQVYGAISELDLMLEVLKFSKDARQETQPAKKEIIEALAPLNEDDAIVTLAQRSQTKKEKASERIKTKFMEFVDSHL